DPSRGFYENRVRRRAQRRHRALDQPVGDEYVVGVERGDDEDAHAGRGERAREFRGDAGLIERERPMQRETAPSAFRANVARDRVVAADDGELFARARDRDEVAARPARRGFAGGESRDGVQIWKEGEGELQSLVRATGFEPVTSSL